MNLDNHDEVVAQWYLDTFPVGAILTPYVTMTPEQKQLIARMRDNILNFKPPQLESRKVIEGQHQAIEFFLIVGALTLCIVVLMITYYFTKHT